MAVDTTDPPLTWGCTRRRTRRWCSSPQPRGGEWRTPRRSRVAETMGRYLHWERARERGRHAFAVHALSVTEGSASCHSGGGSGSRVVDKQPLPEVLNITPKSLQTLFSSICRRPWEVAVRPACTSRTMSMTTSRCGSLPSLLRG